MIHLYSLTIILYMVYLYSLFKKYRFMSLVDPVTWMLILTFFFNLFPNYSLFKINPFLLDENIKVETDLLLLIISLIILVVGFVVQKIYPIRERYCVSNIVISPHVFKASIWFFLIGMFYFIILYVIFLPAVLKAGNVLERKAIFGEILQTRFWIFSGLFFISSIIISVKLLKKRFNKFLYFSIFFMSVISILPLLCGYRLIIAQFYFFYLIFYILVAPKEKLYLVRKFIIVAALIFLILVPLVRVFDSFDLSPQKFLEIPGGEFIFVRQSLDIGYEKIFNESNAGDFFHALLLSFYPDFLRWEEVRSIDAVLAENYAYGEGLGLATHYINEGIYHGGWIGVGITLMLQLFFVSFCRFLIFRSKSLIFFLCGVYTISTSFHIYRSGSYLYIISFMSFFVFSFWILGRVKRGTKITRIRNTINATDSNLENCPGI